MLALEVYVHRLAGAIAQMAASLGGLDVARLHRRDRRASRRGPRARGRRALGFLGVAVDRARNEGCAGEADISADGGAGADARHPGARGPRDGASGAGVAERRRLPRNASRPDVRAQAARAGGRHTPATCSARTKPSDSYRPSA